MVKSGHLIHKTAKSYGSIIQRRKTYRRSMACRGTAAQLARPTSLSPMDRYMLLLAMRPGYQVCSMAISCTFSDYLRSLNSDTRGIIMNANALPAYLASSPEDYARLHLKKDEIELWEDGMRTDGSKGTYEWWYFDVRASDGSTLVITFLTKNYTDVDHPLQPLILLNYDRPDGTKVDKS